MSRSPNLRRALCLPLASLSLVSGSLVVWGSTASAASPTITGFSPASGPVGTKVTITGSGFSPGPVTVRFDGVKASGPVVNSAHTEIKVKVPPLAPSGPISVTLPSGTGATGNRRFMVTYGATMSPRKLFGGQQFRMSGSAFPPDTDVLVTIDGSRFAGVGTDRFGDFTLVRPVPVLLRPGPSQTLDFSCPHPELCPPPLTITFTLFSDWPMSRYDAGDSGDNTAEWRLGVNNLGPLESSLTAIGDDYYGPPVEGDGWVVSANDSSSGPGAHLIGFGDTFKGFWEGDTDSPLTAAPAVSGSTVYATTADMLYAFPVNPKLSSCSLFTCPPSWTATLNTAGFANADPYSPVVADGTVYLTGHGNDMIYAFDANGITHCSGTPTVCSPLWTQGGSSVISQLYGPPAVSPTTSGGNGDIYVTADFKGSNRLIAFFNYGGTDYLGDVLPVTSLSGPALMDGRIVVSAWNASSKVASLYLLNQTAGQVQWQSSALGGTGPPTTPALTPVRAYVANNQGQLSVFRFSACSTSPCPPRFTSPTLGASHDAAPSVANGVVFLAANTQKNGTDIVYAFDAAGTQGCSGTPTVCNALFDSIVGRVDAGSDIGVFGGTIWTVDNGAVLRFNPSS